MEFQIIAGEPCLDFINTLDNRPLPQLHKELLSTYQDLAEFAEQAGLIGSAKRRRLLRAAEAQPAHAMHSLRKAVEFRECLYRIFSTRLKKRKPSSADIAQFNRFHGEALSNLQLAVHGRGFRPEWREASEPRLDSILWPVVKSAGDLLTGKDLERVRECKSPSCRWLFIDRSKNHSRRWCDMSVCGNRVKARRFYRRQRARSGQ